MSALTVTAPGVATSVQDAGRPGWAHLGVPVSGALDPALVAQLNRLVGNPPGAAVLETAGGLVVQAERALTIAATPAVAVHQMAPGETVRIDPPAGDLWGYLAVRGGLAVDPVLGSRSRDGRAGIGPPPIHDGDRLPVGPEPDDPVIVDQGAPPRRPARVRVWPGPRRDWFVTDAWSLLTTATWEISPEVDRVGVRLRGPVLARAVEAELPSEGAIAGAVQVPPDGRPVVMSRDHPTTGGYPVIAVVDPDDLADLLQARPGTRVRLDDAEGPADAP